ncbi:MAG: class I SAM-dependent methyltransferase [Sphingomonadales bacterium]|nr:class I SAM-dependent methyltransferase [Sphingomonadales bacterium]
MTSREATKFLPRNHDEVENLERGFRHWATLIGIGAIQWPWLLRSLRGGSKADKRALLERLELPLDALPNLGSWKADTHFLHRIVDWILAEQPELVVEFGTGASSLIIARALQLNGKGRLISFDQYEDFIESTQQWLGEYGLTADLRCVPLVASPEPWPGLWYDHGALPDDIDLLIVDGPCWTIHPFVRGAADGVFSHLRRGGVVLLDDGARPGERIVRKRWEERWPDFDFHLAREGAKGTVVGIRRA